MDIFTETPLKLPEHLKAYWKKHEESNAEKNALEINRVVYDNITRLLQPLSGTIPCALVANAQLVNQQVQSGHTIEGTQDIEIED